MRPGVPSLRPYASQGTSTHIACEKGHAEALRQILRHGADIEAHVSPLEDPRTPLHLASEYAHEESNPYPGQSLNSLTLTPALTLTLTRYAHEECVALLLQRRADVLAELPTSFLQQFKNYRLLAHHIRRASCHAAALSTHFKDEGWRDCVQVLDDAVAERRR